jgi:hypothetical protein
MHVQELDEVLGYTTPGTDRYRYPGTRIVPATVLYSFIPSPFDPRGKRWYLYVCLVTLS